ncbi:hypothetical protein P152DRAFT_246688 [Eremomyces bilateralis CBS 781.70]|uniref:C2H2-type domain-containing protein n=1 Tax=Eremomyces bilateralis CBS 781.70 TaxID=1392243 RepID=A0A6G1GB18_9PEZI|nr:uncharacterized protein P152DRAFT_246688 [Eremomyces bilateralis CBS 781.70]KAF1815126.1 hypothetical protein P152DRAFT_246688 [Eremomyces bilateralis CBS 781.70]
MLRISEAIEGPGHFPCLKPEDIAKWTQTVSGPDISDFIYCGPEEFLQDMPDSKDDGFSIGSSAPDSAYMSQSDTGHAQPSSGSFYQGPSQYLRRHAIDTHQRSTLSPGLFSDASAHYPSFAIGQQFPPSSHASELDDDSTHILFPSPIEGRFIPSHDQLDTQSGWDQASWTVQGSGQPPRTEAFEERGTEHSFIDTQFPQPMQYSLSSQSTQRFEISEDTTSMHGLLNRTGMSGVPTPTSSLVSTDYSKNLPRLTNDPQDAIIFGPNIALHFTGPGSTGGSPEDSGDIDVQEDVQSSSAGGKTTGSSSRSGEEGSRSDPLYKALPGPNGQYRCPFAEDGTDCGHKETKLKCNYDKYIDSHLKPFRCRGPDCGHHQFSSTACLLRHEREMHGMHGHGSRPHLCLYEGCERSVSGNGFPRRYNLLDHMRRVHDYVAGAVDFPRDDAIPERKSRKRKAAEGSSPVEKSARPKTPVSSTSSRHPSNLAVPHTSAQRSAAPQPTVAASRLGSAQRHISQGGIQPQASPNFQQQMLTSTFQHRQRQPAYAAQGSSADFKSSVASLMSQLASIKGPLDDDGLQEVSLEYAKMWAIVKDAKNMRRA